MSATARTVEAPRVRLDSVTAWGRRNNWTLGLVALLFGLLVVTSLIQPTYGAVEIQGLGTSCLPLGLAAVAQAIVVIAGGIDLSIGSMMALTSVVAATQMKDNQNDQFAIVVVVGVLLLGVVLGAINGSLVVLTKVPDIVVTLAMSFVWAGFALLVIAHPGGHAATWLKDLVVGPFVSDWVPLAVVVMAVVVAVVWLPLTRSKLGVSIYAVGSSPLAAFRSGVPVGRTKFAAYVLCGLYSSVAGLSLVASTGIGTPVPGPYTLMSVAAVVLGGVNLAGGRGGVVGPILGVFVLQLIRTDMTFLNIDTNLALVAQGLILVGVLMVGSLVQMRRSRA
jgi:ribose transport system permease protein